MGVKNEIKSFLVKSRIFNGRQTKIVANRWNEYLKKNQLKIMYIIEE